MDKVRFGRAIGEGTRHAAKSLTKALAAAAAPDPGPKPSAARPATIQSFSQPPRPAAPAPHRASGSMFAPVKRFSRTLWLEVTGTFFALIAVSMARGIWIYHAAIRASSHTPDAQKFYAFTFLFLLFAYFALSSFIRARRASHPATRPSSRR